MHTNLACALDIIDAVPNTIVSRLFPDEEHANQASALELLQALEIHFATLRATDVVEIKAMIFCCTTISVAIDWHNIFVCGGN